MIDVVPLLAGSQEIAIERPITRSSGQSVVLKTSHLCQWLESAACFYTILTAQAFLLSKGLCRERGVEGGRERVGEGGGERERERELNPKSVEREREGRGRERDRVES